MESKDYLYLVKLIKSYSNEVVDNNNRNIFFSRGKYKQIVFTKHTTVKNLYLQNGFESEKKSQVQPDYLCMGKFLSDEINNWETLITNTPKNSLPIITVTGIKIHGICNISYDSLVKVCKQRILNNEQDQFRAGVFESLGFCDLVLISRSDKLNKTMDFLQKIHYEYEFENKDNPFDFFYSFVGFTDQEKILESGSEILTFYSYRPNIDHTHAKDILINKKDKWDTPPKFLFGVYDLLTNLDTEKEIREKFGNFDDFFEIREQFFCSQISDFEDGKNRISNVTDIFTKNRNDNQKLICKKIDSLQAEFKEIYLSEKEKRKGYINGRKSSLLIHLSYLLSLISEFFDNNIFDEFLLPELLDIILVFFRLTNLSLKKGIENSDIYSAALNSIDVGLSDINRLMYYWSVGNKAMIATPSVNIIPISGSTTKLAYVYMIILNIFERISENNFPKKPEKIKAFITPSYTGATKTKKLFSFIGADETSRLLSIVTPIEDFFDLNTCILLLFHEMGHNFPINRILRNQVLSTIVVEEVYKYIFYALILQDFSSIQKDFIEKGFTEKEINWFIRDLNRYVRDWLVNAFMTKATPIKQSSEYIDFELKDYKIALYEDLLSTKFKDEIVDNLIDNKEILISSLRDFINSSNNVNLNILETYQKKEYEDQESLGKQISAEGLNYIKKIELLNNDSYLQNQLIILFGDQIEKVGLLSSCKSQRIRFNNNLVKIIKGQIRFQNLEELIITGQQQVIENSYRDFLEDTIEKTAHIIDELKADFFMIKLLGLSEEKYQNLLQEKRNFEISENDDWEQCQTRLEIMRLANPYNTVGVSTQRNVNSSILHILDSNYDTKKRIAAYLESCEDDLSIAMDEDIFISCKNFVNGDINHKSETEFINEIIRIYRKSEQIDEN